MLGPFPPSGRTYPASIAGTFGTFELRKCADMRIGVLASIGSTIDAFFPPLIARWEEQGHEVVTAAETPAQGNHDILKNVSRRPSLKNLRGHRDVARWVKSRDLDVVITNTATASFIARVRPVGVPVIYFCHGLHWDSPKGISSRMWQLAEKAVLKNTDAVVVINHDDEDWFRRNFDPERVHRLPSGVGVPLDEFPRSPMPPVTEGIRLAWGGEFSHRKRPQLAVQVMAELRDLGTPCHLTMCGDGPLLTQTEEQIEELGLGEDVTLAGRVPRFDDYIARSHALLLTSTWEGLPRVGLESLAIGRPVFAFDVKGTRSLPAVTLAPGDSPRALAELIARHPFEDPEAVALIEPAELSPIHSADAIADIAASLVGR